jgi:hypothetical protein
LKIPQKLKVTVNRKFFKGKFRQDWEFPSLKISAQYPASDAEQSGFEYGFVLAKIFDFYF